MRTRRMRTAIFPLVIFVLTLHFCGNTQAQEDVKKVYDRPYLYPNGILEVGALALTTKYFGEFTDNNVGISYGLVSRYLFPFFPELGLGVRLTHGQLVYLRRYKVKFGNDFFRQFPQSDFPQAGEIALLRNTTVTSFEPLIFLNLFPRGRLNYYLFGGYSVMPFYPDEITENPLGIGGGLRNYDFWKDENFTTFHAVAGLGIDYYLTRKFSVGVQAVFRNIKTDYLDGYAQINSENLPTNPDYFTELGLKFSTYLFGSDDLDGDGLSNDLEEELGFNPFSADSDEDGVSDYDEYVTFNSNPLSADSDSDGVNDDIEISIHKTNPLSSDTDGDGLPDIDEIHVYRTNPREKDSDYDGLDDREEIRRGTNPLSADTDADGVPDPNDDCPSIFGTVELKGCPIPSKQDSVVVRDTVVVVKEVVKIAEGQSYTPYGINFEIGKSDIKVESEIILDDVAQWLQSKPGITVEIRGHTDNVGPDEKNRQLSENRALAVRDYLVRIGIDPMRLSAKGYGKSQPVVPNNSEKGKARNRRIEFYIKTAK